MRMSQEIGTCTRHRNHNKTSKESLKAFTSVSKIDISQLQEEIIVIDITAKEWNKEPLWGRFLVWGVAI